MAPQLAIGIDLGGTHIKGVLLRANGEILQELHADTDDERDDTANIANWRKEVVRMVAAFKSLAKTTVPIGISAPGLTDDAHRSIAYMPGRLAGLQGLNWADFLEEQSVVVINDANAALLAEKQFGAARGKENVALFTLGTGVGGAILLQGKLYEGWLSRAGHFGHISLHPQGETGIVNLPGTLEMAIGNATIVQRSKGKYATTHALVEAYRSGDAWATLVWLESIRNLAVGISSVINVLAPELVVLSGGIIKAGDALFKPLETFLELYEWRPGAVATPIEKASFEALAGAVGAACFALQESNLDRF